MQYSAHHRWRWLIAAFVLALATTTAWATAITDHGIVNAIEDEMMFDRAVPSNSIDISSSDGIVTLEGTVNNLLAKDRATTLAEAVKGVRGVVNRIQVEPDVKRSAADLETMVDSALLSDPATDSWEIDVSANESGVVTLTGEVQSWQERDLCTKVAKGVAGVTEVRNTIRIDYASERPDLEIKPEIEKVLEWNALVDDALIDVTVDDGHVTLTGTVGSAAEKHQAELDAWVAGVQSVDTDGLKVARWARDEDLRSDKYALKSDEAIRAAVDDALLRDPRVMSFNVEPRVDNGRVTLHGVVDNAKAKQAATYTTRNVVGVTEVRNYLKVRPVQPVDDQVIESKISAAIDRDPWLEPEDVHLNVENGEVYLTGTVDWRFERQRALDVAFRTQGVTDVHNRLEVNSQPTTWTYRQKLWRGYGIPTMPFGNDQAIASAIESQLWWSPFVDADDVAVDVRNGVAYLSGTVDSWREYQAAAKNALEGGAIDVRNDLEVSFMR